MIEPDRHARLETRWISFRIEARLLLRPGFIDDLRNADTAAATWELLDSAERELIDS